MPSAAVKLLVFQWTPSLSSFTILSETGGFVSPGFMAWKETGALAKASFAVISQTGRLSQVSFSPLSESGKFVSATFSNLSESGKLVQSAFVTLPQKGVLIQSGFSSLRETAAFGASGFTTLPTTSSVIYGVLHGDFAVTMPPTPTLIPPIAGQTVIFTANLLGGQPPYTYNWDLGDGTAATGNPVSHVYATPGSYRVRLTANDSLRP